VSRPLTWESFVAAQDRYPGNDPRNDGRFADEQQRQLAELMTDPDAVQQAIQDHFDYRQGREIAEALIAGDHAEVGRLMAEAYTQRMPGIVDDRMRADYEDLTNG